VEREHADERIMDRLRRGAEAVEYTADARRRDARDRLDLSNVSRDAHVFGFFSPQHGFHARDALVGESLQRIERGAPSLQVNSRQIVLQGTLRLLRLTAEVVQCARNQRSMSDGSSPRSQRATVLRATPNRRAKSA